MDLKEFLFTLIVLLEQSKCYLLIRNGVPQKQKGVTIERNSRKEDKYPKSQ